VVVNGTESSGIAAYRVNNDATTGCLVGFLLKSCMRTRTEYIGRHAVITKLRHLSRNAYHRERSYRNCGAAAFKFVRNQPAAFERNQRVAEDDNSISSRDSY
jgi:hypothetical protein